MTQPPRRITAELLLIRGLPASAEADVLEFFELFDTGGECRRAHSLRSPEIEWLVLAALPLQAFLQNLGTLAVEDAYRAFKRLIGSLRHHESHTRTSKEDKSSIVLEDINSGLQIVVESDLPEIAFRQLSDLDLAQFRTGRVRFDRALDCWRADDSGLDAAT